MPRHSNAIGYLIELRDQEAKSWFSKICDLAISSDGSDLPESDLETIMEILIGIQNYEPLSASPITSSSTTAPPQPSILNYIKNLSNFKNYKKLSDTLSVNFDKRITIIFGCNGTGKTSLCESIKILANPNMPNSPIQNIRRASLQDCSFAYQFEGDSAPSTWDSSQGFGLYSDRIKFYDSTVAVQNITESVTPENIVKIEPFRLEIFSFAGKYIRQLKNYFGKLHIDHRNKVSQDVDLIKAKFSDFLLPNEQVISNLSDKNCDELEKFIEKYVRTNSTEASEYENNASSLAKIKQARNKDGLKLQINELKLLRNFGHQVKSFIKLVETTSLKSARNIATQLSSKKELQKNLAEQIAPHGIDPNDFRQFISTSNKFFNYESPENESCPFCRRPFDEVSLETVKKYHEFLVNRLGQQIENLEKKLTEEYNNLKKVKAFNLPDFEFSTLPLSQELILKINKCISKNKNIIPEQLNKLEDSSVSGYGELSDLKEAVSEIANEVLQRYRAIKLSSSNEDEFEKQCNKLELRIKSFEFKICFENNEELIKNTIKHIKLCNMLEHIASGDDFTTMLRKITLKNKEAYSELVVAEFERILDEEYQKLSGQNMSDFGISLMSTGSDQSVIVNPRIGDEPIQRILSEGEQKIHALALFFAESTVSEHEILVFDDPVTSFDYNYSGIYAQRLKNFILNNPHIQVIVLTHNWDFFVHLQLMLNQSGLNQHTSIQVLEHCSIVEEYTEKIDSLKQEIEHILVVSGEPPNSEKERLSGRLRRLIESIINRHVFNGERHQFKQKTMAVSVFEKFTKVVPLTLDEARKLRDIYRNVSPPAHDDLRNYYASKPKALFQQWYADLCTLENDIIARR